MPTGIEWTDETWNPIRGCSRVSEGCRNCYAETMAGRFSGPGKPFEGLVTFGGGRPKWNGQIRFVEEHLLDPLKWKKPRRIFVNSMSDLFHPGVTDEMRDRIIAVMALSPRHTFQCLTKRPERMLAYLNQSCGRIADMVMRMRRERGDHSPVAPLPHITPGAAWWPLANVWLGVSVENQAAADERIPLLLQTPAAVRFISAEPLLGAINLCAIHRPNTDWRTFDSLRKSTLDGRASEHLDWVICGGESGPGARPMHPDWARGLRDDCVAAGVPFFFKHFGEWIPTLGERHGLKIHEHRQMSDGEDMARVGKKAAGHLLDGVEWHQFPEESANA